MGIDNGSKGMTAPPGCDSVTHNCSLVRVTESVAHATNCLNEFGTGPQRPANGSEVNVDRAIGTNVSPKPASMTSARVKARPDRLVFRPKTG